MKKHLRSRKKYAPQTASWKNGALNTTDLNSIPRIAQEIQENLDQKGKFHFQPQSTPWTMLYNASSLMLAPLMAWTASSTQNAAYPLASTATYLESNRTKELFIPKPIPEAPKKFVSQGRAVNEKAYARSSWMQQIPDNRKLTELSIPGTHGSIARYGLFDDPSGFLRRTVAHMPLLSLFADGFRNIIVDQSLSLEDQLEAGIRVLDIRLRRTKNGLEGYHGPIYQWINFDDVLGTLQHFLKQHPTETVIMSIQEECTAHQPLCKPLSETQSFEQHCERYLNRYSDIVWKGNVNQNTVILGDVRGKIIVKKTSPNEISPDEYELKDRESLERKWEKVKSRLKKTPQTEGSLPPINILTATGTTANYFNLIYLSSTSVATGQCPTTPSTQFLVNGFFASRCQQWLNFEGMNKKVADWIQAQDQEKLRLGVIIMDHPDQALIDLIIRSNGNVRLDPNMKEQSPITLSTVGVEIAAFTTALAAISLLVKGSQVTCAAIRNLRTAAKNFSFFRHSPEPQIPAEQTLDAATHPRALV